MSEYKILRVAGILWTERNKGVQTSQLERLVADHIAYGWVPIGGVSVEIQEGRTRCCKPCGATRLTPKFERERY